MPRGGRRFRREGRARQRRACRCAYGCGDETQGLERENRELRQANEILRKASAYFAQAELDRRFKP
ncbi:transposase [Mesorhizobium sp. LSJC268A00]|nr:transposase [Mesorhizobium sp. LSJC268A00]